MSENRAAADETRDVVSSMDRLFLSIFTRLAQQARDHAGESAQYVMKISEGYLSETASRALDDFYNIYFSDSERVEQSKVDVNQEVDSIVDEVQALIESGGDLGQLELIEEDEDLKKIRLGLSGIQKELESIIRLEEGIREKLVPVMVSMQFEDAMNQRLQHIVAGWEMIMEASREGRVFDPERIGAAIGAMTSSVEESELFYREVLGREAPREMKNRNHTLLDMFG